MARALDGAVREPGRERAVARVEPEPLGLAAQRPIGPRAVLEDAAQDGVSDAAGGRGHRTDVQSGPAAQARGPHMPTKSVMGHSRRSTNHSSRAQARRSDLRFAGLVSAGMIVTVLTIGALLAPLLAWNELGLA